MNHFNYHQSITAIVAPSSSNSRVSSMPRRKPRQRSVPPRAFMCRTCYPSLMRLTDEFSSQGSDRDYQNTVHAEDAADAGISDKFFVQPLPATVQASGRCKALYDYDANMYDELTIRTG